MTEPTVPADLNDDEAWVRYCAALPDPTDAEIAAVVAEFVNPYAEQTASCEEGFRTSARMIWQARTEGRWDPLEYNYLRNAMRTYAATRRIYQTLTEAAALGFAAEMHFAASVEGADAYTVTFDGTVK